MNTENPAIVEATPENFEREVIERSATVPVVVDFWAEWCGPCRRLGPLLETLAGEYGGKFVLVKADTEKLPEIAAGFGVQSIPAVYGLRDGKVVDGFVGLLGESAIRAFLDRLLPTPAEQAVAEAEALAATDPAAAESRYRGALALAPDDPRARIGLARLHRSQGRDEDARAEIAHLERRGYLEPEAEALKAELALKAQAAGSGDVEAARTAVADHPADLAARLKLAEALAAVGEYREALDLGLELVERDRRGVGESARKTMLNIFNVLPADSDLATEYRRKLSLVL